jgi:hypothetical protein
MLNQLPGTLDETFVDQISADERKDSVSDAKVIRSRGHDSPPIEDKNNGEGHWLGRHQDMSSPGKIILHRDRIGRAFWVCIRELDCNADTKTDSTLRRILCQSLVYMVLAHERFHDFCDVIGRITGCRGGQCKDYKKDWKSEEALATAWEWQEVQRSFEPFGRLRKLLRDAWIRWWFEEIGACGYKEWKKYSHSCFFKEGLAYHLNNGHHLDNRLYAKLMSQAWRDSTVTYWKVTDENQNPGEKLEMGATGTAMPASSVSQQWIERKGRAPLFCHKNKVTLKNVHKKEYSKIIGPVLCLNGNAIKSPLLGLLYVIGLDRISLYGLSGDLLNVFMIINKHLPNKMSHKRAFDCQSELLDAGFDEYAGL